MSFDHDKNGLYARVYPQRWPYLLAADREFRARCDSQHHSGGGAQLSEVDGKRNFRESSTNQVISRSSQLSLLLITS